MIPLKIMSKVLYSSQLDFQDLGFAEELYLVPYISQKHLDLNFGKLRVRFGMRLLLLKDRPLIALFKPFKTWYDCPSRSGLWPFEVGVYWLYRRLAKSPKRIWLVTGVSPKTLSFSDCQNQIWKWFKLSQLYWWLRRLLLLTDFYRFECKIDFFCV